MAISVGDVLSKIAVDISETDNSFTSLAWSQTEMIGYLNYAEKDFLMHSGAIKYDTEITLIAGSGILLDWPDNILNIDRAAFNGKRLFRQSSLNLELEDRNWRNNTVGLPKYWHEDNVPYLNIELNKIPAAGGLLRIFGDWLPDPYTVITDIIHLQDCWEPYLRWKVLALALAKDCEDQDLPRSAYAEQRYQVGIQLAQRLVKGVTQTGMKAS